MIEAGESEKLSDYHKDVTKLDEIYEGVMKQMDWTKSNAPVVIGKK